MRLSMEELSKEEIIKRYYRLEKELQKLKQDKEALEKELRKYKNPNTPPSANQHLKPSFSKGVEVKSHRRGAPKNHVGTTKPKLDTQNVRHISGTECPGCQSKNWHKFDSTRYFPKIDCQRSIAKDSEFPRSKFCSKACACQRAGDYRKGSKGRGERIFCFKTEDQKFKAALC